MAQADAGACGVAGLAELATLDTLSSDADRLYPDIVTDGLDGESHRHLYAANLGVGAKRRYRGRWFPARGRRGGTRTVAAAARRRLPPHLTHRDPGRHPRTRHRRACRPPVHPAHHGGSRPDHRRPRQPLHRTDGRRPVIRAAQVLSHHDATSSSGRPPSSTATVQVRPVATVSASSRCRDGWPELLGGRDLLADQAVHIRFLRLRAAQRQRPTNTPHGDPFDTRHRCTAIPAPSLMNPEGLGHPSVCSVCCTAGL
jgi:hypothetical protein